MGYWQCGTHCTIPVEDQTKDSGRSRPTSKKLFMKPSKDYHEQQLTWATSRRLPDDDPLDEEHQLLRQDWEQFVQLIETSQDTGPFKVTVPPDQNRSTSRPERLYVVAVIAATLFISLISSWAFYQRQQSTLPIATNNSETATNTSVADNYPHRTDKDPNSAVPPTNIPYETTLAQTEPNTSPVTQDEPTKHKDDLYAWEDSWDEELALAEQAIVDIGTRWNSVDAYVDSVSHEIDEYEDLWNETRL